MAKKVFIGTELKLNINIDPMGGVTMDEYEFEIELSCGAFKSRGIVVNKSQTKRIDSDNYIVCFDTNDVGTGKLRCRVTAYIPDEDFKDGKRTEVVEIDTGIEIVKSL